MCYIISCWCSRVELRSIGMILSWRLCLWGLTRTQVGFRCSPIMIWSMGGIHQVIRMEALKKSRSLCSKKSGSDKSILMMKMSSKRTVILKCFKIRSQRGSSRVWSGIRISMTRSKKSWSFMMNRWSKFWKTWTKRLRMSR